MGSKFVLGNPKKCVGCKSCMSACLFKHFEAGDLPIPRINVLGFDESTVAVTCHHCAEAPCVTACPVRALYFDGDRVAVDMWRCIGCRGCVRACPYGIPDPIQRATDSSSALGPTSRQVIIKCDLCYDRTGGPACVEACTSGAITVVDQDDIDRFEAGQAQAS